MKIIFENDTDFDFNDEYKAIVSSVAKKALKIENFIDDVEISFTLTNNNRIREINSKFRGIDKVTDVLSFPLLSFPCDIKEENHVLPIGDIMICIERARLQAKEYGHSLKREIAFLSAHSMLHLLGYDHNSEEEEKIMFDKQDEILSDLGYTRDME